MPVSHARVIIVTSADDELPGLLEVLARVPDPRRKRGRRYTLVFMLAGAKNFREIGDQAADLPQEVLARLGGRPHPLLRTITAPSEKRIRTVLQQIDAARQQVKLFAAMRHEQKVIIAQHAIPEDTNEITQVRELLDPVDLAGAVVTGDAAHAQRETAAYIAGPAKDGGRESDYFLFEGKPAGPAARRLRRYPGRLPARAGSRRDRLRPRPDHQAITVGHRRC